MLEAIGEVEQRVGAETGDLHHDHVVAVERHDLRLDVDDRLVPLRLLRLALRPFELCADVVELARAALERAHASPEVTASIRARPSRPTTRS